MLKIAIACALALDCAHKQKVVHPDINPAFRKVIHDFIGKRPEKRHQNGKKLAAHLSICMRRMGIADEVVDIGSLE